MIMFCKNCGNETPKDGVVCLKCGFDPMSESKFCNNCGVETNEKQVVCVKCGVELSNVVNKSTSKKASDPKICVLIWGYCLTYFGTIWLHSNLMSSFYMRI